MVTLEIMHEYHWTYQEYLDQPSWLIDLIIEKMVIDAKKAAREAAANNTR